MTTGLGAGIGCAGPAWTGFGDVECGVDAGGVVPGLLFDEALAGVFDGEFGAFAGGFAGDFGCGFGADFGGGFC